MKTSVIDYSSEIYLDLVLSPEKAAVMNMRLEIMNCLRTFIEHNRLTQNEAAEILGISQSRVSNLIRGQWEKFSLDMLIILATKTGIRFSLSRPQKNTIKTRTFRKPLESDPLPSPV